MAPFSPALFFFKKPPATEVSEFWLVAASPSGLTFDMSGSWKRAKPAGRRPLNGRVRFLLTDLSYHSLTSAACDRGRDQRGRSNGTRAGLHRPEIGRA